MMTIGNLYKLYGCKIRYKRQSLTFREDALICITGDNYKIPISWCFDIRCLPTCGYITINRTKKQLSIGSVHYDFEFSDIDTLPNFLNFVGNAFFPNGYKIVGLAK